MIRTSRLSRVAGLVVAGLAVAALTAAACGDDDGDGSGDETPTRAAATTAAATPTTAAAEPTQAASETPAGGATVSMGDAGLVDARGFSLYFFANDTAGSGASACNGGCASAWPPLVASGPLTAGAGVTGELGTITRDDGTEQVTYNGLPLYFFASDEAPGDTNGKDIPNWSLAQP